MKRVFVLAALALAPSPLLAQGQPSGQSTVLHARTASELAELCSARPAANDPASTAKLNFCLGYAQASLDAATRQTGGKRSYCVPNPSPTRQATMAEFAGWVRATPANAGMNSQEALMTFMAQRFPCKT